MSLQSKHFIQALKNGVVPATGCTEPICRCLWGRNLYGPTD